MAGHTSCAGNVVIAEFGVVAVRALARRHGVQACKREACRRVVKRGICPGACVVALITGLREICRDVVGLSRRLVVLQMAADTSRACQVVVIVDVTVGA